MGLMTFNNMPRDDMPPFKFRAATVITYFPGASPERVEMLVTDKIEKVVQEIPEVKFIESESRTGISILIVMFKDNVTELRPIYDNLRRKVEKVKSELPNGVYGPDVNDELEDVFGILIGLTGEGYSYAELKEVADDVRDGLIKLSNSAKVEIAGVQEERIFIDYDNAQLAKLGLTKQGLEGILNTTNIIIPGGDVTLGNERIILEPTGNFESIDDLKMTLIPVGRDNQMVYLGDIANVYRGYVDPQRSIVKIKGKQGLVIGVSLKKGGNIMDLGEDVDELLDYYRQIYPIGIDFERVASQDIVVDDSVDDFISNLIQSITVVLLVMLLFLGLRTGLVVASLIPTAIVMTLLLMSSLGEGLNQVTLASLIIALGMLVDNAIVMSESIMVKMEKGIKPFNAAIESARELYLPLLVASLTTSAAFLSFFLAESIMGEIVGKIFVVVSIALLSSWLLSLTMIPMFCMYFIKIKKNKKNKNKPNRFKEFYKRLLEFNLRRPYVISISIIVAFFLAMFGFSKVPFIFFPDSDRAIVTANIELPIGTTLSRTEEVIEDIEQYITDSLLVNDEREEGIVSWSSYLGEGAPKYDLGYMPPESSPNTAHLLMNTTSDVANQVVIDRIYDYCFENYPEMKAQVGRLGEGGGSANPIAIRIVGKEPDILFNIVDSIKLQLASIDGTKNIDDNWGMRTKKMIVNINQSKARMAGISSEDIAISLQTMFSGAQTGQFRENDKTIPIIMRRTQSEQLDMGKLETMNIFAQYTGKNVPLKQVADINLEWQYSKILRRDQNKTVTITSELQAGYTAAEITAKIAPWLEEYSMDWELGYTFNLGGEAEESEEGMSSVSKNLPLSIFIILLLLIGQFNSMRKSAIVLLTIPLGLIGVTIGLLVAHSYFGFMGFLGIISLSGIVINNAIVLLDRIKIEINGFKRKPQEAIIVAAQQRFRPIMLTTATTSLGLIPLWFGGGLMWEPMAISIIFGLIFATIITLLFVPVLYKVFFKVSFKRTK